MPKTNRSPARWRIAVMALAVVALVASTSALSAQRADQPEALLQAARAKQVVEGKLDEAIKIYRDVLAKHSANRPVAARALVGLGQCYEKLGAAQAAEARKAYETIVAQYADQPDALAHARARLAALPGAGGAAGEPTMTTRRVWAGPDVSPDGAVSPDGRFLSYTDWPTGNLAIHDFSTGKNRPVVRATSSEESNQSIVSPDGKLIAYNWWNKDGFYDLRVVDIDGVNAKVVYSDKEHLSWISPRAWSPDGGHVLAAFTSTSNTYDLVLVRVADGSTRSIRKGSAPMAAFSPDGRYIAYGLEGNISLFDLQTGRESVLIMEPAKHRVEGWAPDGRHILFSSSRSATPGWWLIAVAGGQAQGEPTFLRQDTGVPLGFVRSGGFHYAVSNSVNEVELAELDPASGNIVSPPQPASRRWPGATKAPDWSPDGRFLAYVASRGPRSSVVVRSMETGEERELPAGEMGIGLVLRWLPDGKGIVVAGFEPKKDGALVRIDVQTGQVTSLMPLPERGTFPRFDVSPDGNTIFYFKPPAVPDADGYHLVARDLRSGQEADLGRRKKGQFSVAVAPDGKRLVVGAYEGKFQVLFVMPVAGGEARELVRIDSTEANGRVSPSWTPDGRHVIFAKGQKGNPIKNVQVWRVAAEGGEPERLGLTVDEMWWLRMHPDGRRVATGSMKGDFEVWVLENFLPKPAAAKPK